ncbi:MAG: glycogen/starch/alpha-glucan phosphorylase [Candidatus Lambdaproteobacteria bacterium]|nr:glycogen/starch/alpha-glucan phosphorylase [Candidatus Lambdaproteobacteria bacterium]
MDRKNKSLAGLTSYDLPMEQDAIKLSFANHVEYSVAKDEYSATGLDFYMAAALTTRDRLFDRWNKTQQNYYNKDQKRVYYLSLEFLIGRLLEDALLNLGMREQMAGAVDEFGLSLEDIIQTEWDAGLGNGGLGRLAACFLDSMATLGIAAMGYGIRYEYGIFKQVLQHGAQHEYADNWLRYGNPWEVARPQHLFPVHFRGRVETVIAPDGRTVARWVDTEDVMAMAYDIPVPGYRNERVNTLRLWSAKATREFDFSYFNQGDYVQALHDKTANENISRVLYPNDTLVQGKELRLQQEFFFVSATLQDALGRHLKTHPGLSNLPDKVVFQLNDTHPAIAVAELMRLLVDERGIAWETAWDITSRCCAYTNHTVLPEALEKWPVPLFERVLPRHLQIIYEINRRFLEDVSARYPGDNDRLRRLSLIEEGPEKQVRMAHLAIVGSFSVNGVSALHSQILRDRIFADFAELTPAKFNNKTNGITPRRWLLKANPGQSALITEHIGDGWVTNLPQLERLVPLAGNADFQARWQAVKLANKERLAGLVASGCGITVDPRSLFDVQVKRLHEYKRQLLNALHIVALYREYRENPPAHAVPRTFLFAGKAAPGYFMAKLIIRFINAVGAAVNSHPKVSPLLRVAFLPNYSVSLAERIMPAAEVSEQISTAGTEASGTGNMKLALNGAVTVGTLDGANVEIREAVGAENMFTFGYSYTEVEQVLARGYHPREFYESNPELRAILDSIAADEFSRGEPGLFRPLVDSLLGGDPFLVLGDFASYRDCQRRVGQAYADPAAWSRMSILNVAHMGRFSSDLTISAYANEIWNVSPRSGAEPDEDGGAAAKGRSAASSKGSRKGRKSA